MVETNPTSPVMAEEKTGFKCDCGSTKLIPTKNPKLFQCSACKNYYIKKINPVVKEKKLHRNDKCYCGSNKKYKHCHLNK